MSTDHKALESLFTSKTHNQKLQLMAMRLQEWDLKIIYRPGGENTNADASSGLKSPIYQGAESGGG